MITEGGDADGQADFTGLHRRMCFDLGDGGRYPGSSEKRKTIVQTNGKGSNPEFPYQEQHFKIQGMAFTYRDDSKLREEEKLLEQRKARAEEIKSQVEQWMLTVPVRMKRIIRFRCF